MQKLKIELKNLKNIPTGKNKGKKGKNYKIDS